MTNFDKIKAMTSEEFAEFLTNITDCCNWIGGSGSSCVSRCPLYGAEICSSERLLKWLESEVE